ncbi:hypothetical protein LOTGIDRAFT_234660 [Lottia gigantea]|uniref:Sperm-associated antigen 8 n=1 Tax=Lottia gigantea TaxID=225164 RepID=V4A557_LOTGI|nr:hypothetical protein LOTGIDRAFT_234660 [Lottia gigantea]ESO88366.1 hypothetical protein LOTGIDRAFT_234660 [Lottia gigantea]
MSLINQGRNEIRFNNSGGKCLLENWVEERNVSHLEPSGKDQHTKAHVFRVGHPGLLTTTSDAKAENLTTFRVSYKKPESPDVRQIGAKKQLMEQMLYEQISKEVNEEFNPPPPATDFRSVTKVDYTKDFTPEEVVVDTSKHNYKTEQPVTFWTEHRDRVTGVSQVKTKDSGFRKNDAFSKPIDEYWDEPQPYELENYPKM